MHTPGPGTESGQDGPHDTPQPPLPPDMEPVIPQEDPPKPDDPPGGKPPIVAAGRR